uniref:Major facilitator superfamily transporter n=1 Tax=Ganoderma boninense TaxID=34458 RepID=A0A5K1K5S9_9APHY|nr:Major facilitator superfamily transporter [Ganoderma boninense]
MSNGGLLCLSDIATILRQRKIQSPPGTKCALVFDSTPAPTTLVYGIRAFMAALPEGPLPTLLGGAFIYVFFLLTYTARALARRPTLVTREMAAVNDPAFLPWTSAATPRTYLYSTADAVVSFRGIEGHAADARRAGFPVRTVNFQTSAHVSHARDYPERYWGAVQSLWSEAAAMGVHGGHTGATTGARVDASPVEVRARAGRFGGETKGLRWSRPSSTVYRSTDPCPERGFDPGLLLWRWLCSATWPAHSEVDHLAGQPRQRDGTAQPAMQGPDGDDVPKHTDRSQAVSPVVVAQ